MVEPTLKQQMVVLLRSRFYNYGSSYRLTVRDVRPFSCSDHVLRQFNSNRGSYHNFLTFHRIRDDHMSSEVLEYIAKNGFNTTLGYHSNKGRGTYTCSQSNYPLLWGDGPIIVCNTIANPVHVKAYKSEIPPGQEYRITTPGYLLPLYSMRTELTIFREPGIQRIYYERGTWGCDLCDKRGVRCSCEQPINMPIDNFLY